MTSAAAVSPSANWNTRLGPSVPALYMPAWASCQSAGTIPRSPAAAFSKGTNVIGPPSPPSWAATNVAGSNSTIASSKQLR